MDELFAKANEDTLVMGAYYFTLDNRHVYWSTHCRHENHDKCAATEFPGGAPRNPAQCKECASPCVCPCHA